METNEGAQFSADERRAIYRVINERRDVRSHFLSTPVPDAVLARVLNAAHHAPSVGFMQPWDFILVESISLRTRIHAHFQEMKERANIYEGERRKLYASSKLEGILDAPLNLCVTCDRERSKGYRLGRQSDLMTDIYSTVCAVQNLWLAARAESLGVGWVSILDMNLMKELLGLPPDVQVVAYLCIGYVSEFCSRPELEQIGWETRSPITDLIHFDAWNHHDPKRAAALSTI